MLITPGSQRIKKKRSKVNHSKDIKTRKIKRLSVACFLFPQSINFLLINTMCLFQMSADSFSSFSFFFLMNY